jgi:hypothetical protein
MVSERKARTRRTVAVAVEAATSFLVFIAIGGVAVLALWNWLMPSLFGVPPVSFLQALGILALSRIVFGGSGLPSLKRASSDRLGADRWQALTPEERELLRQGARGLEATDGGSVRQ